MRTEVSTQEYWACKGIVIYHVEAKYHSCSPGETKIGLFKNLTERAKKGRGRKQ